MSSDCDPNLVFELISDISDALKEKPEMEVYRYLNILTSYLKGKKCPKEVLDRAIRILESHYPNLSEGRRLLLKEVIDKIRKAGKSRRRTKKAKRGRTRKYRRH